MNVFTVSLFGHRRIDDLRKLENRLIPILRELIQGERYVNFLIGRNGEFDEYAASLIKRVQREVWGENCDLTLVLPYTVADMKYYGAYYDCVVIPEELWSVHPKSAITAKNRWMIERSELVIVYLERNRGGAYAAMKYAERLHRRVVNLGSPLPSMGTFNFS